MKAAGLGGSATAWDDTPVVPLPFDESIVERASLPFSSSSLQALFVAVDTLLRRAYSRSEMKGRYVGAATLLCRGVGLASLGEGRRVQGAGRHMGAGVVYRQEPGGG